MKAQFKYSFRASLTLRCAAVAAVLVMNLVFGLLGYFDIYGRGWKITAVTLCSAALCGMLGICFTTDFELIRGVCSAPAGYLTGLTPVRGWRIILARSVTILVEDVICFTVAISGVVAQALILSGDQVRFPGEQFDTGTFLWMTALLMLAYLYVVLIVFFGALLAKSLFYSMRAGTFLAVLVAAATAYVFSLADFVLAPLGAIRSVGLFYSISLVIGPNIGFLTYIMLNVCRVAALFLASSYLLERKVNI